LFVGRIKKHKGPAARGVQVCRAPLWYSIVLSRRVNCIIYTYTRRPIYQEKDRVTHTHTHTHTRGNEREREWETDFLSWFPCTGITGPNSFFSSTTAGRHYTTLHYAISSRAECANDVLLAFLLKNKLFSFVSPRSHSAFFIFVFCFSCDLLVEYIICFCAWKTSVVLRHRFHFSVPFGYYQTAKATQGVGGWSVLPRFGTIHAGATFSRLEITVIGSNKL